MSHRRMLRTSTFNLKQLEPKQVTPSQNVAGAVPKDGLCRTSSVPAQLMERRPVVVVPRGGKASPKKASPRSMRAELVREASMQDVIQSKLPWMTATRRVKEKRSTRLQLKVEKEAAVLRIQRGVRGWLGRKRAGKWKRAVKHAHRKLDQTDAIVTIQAAVRRSCAVIRMWQEIGKTSAANQADSGDVPCKRGAKTTPQGKHSPSWSESSDASCASTPRMRHVSSLHASARSKPPTPPLLSQKPSQRKYSEEMLSDIFDIIRDHLTSSTDNALPQMVRTVPTPSPPQTRTPFLPYSPTGPITRSYSAEAPRSPSRKTSAATTPLAKTTPLPPAHRPQASRRYKIGPILEERNSPRNTKLPAAVPVSREDADAADDVFTSHPLSGLVLESDEESGDEGVGVRRATSGSIIPARNVRQGGMSGWLGSLKGRSSPGLSCAARTGIRGSQLEMTAS